MLIFASDLSDYKMQAWFSRYQSYIVWRINLERAGKLSIPDKLLSFLNIELAPRKNKKRRLYWNVITARGEISIESNMKWEDKIACSSTFVVRYVISSAPHAQPSKPK
jgi:hypothetical protein